MDALVVDATDPQIGRALGAFRVEACIRRGGLSTVYRARGPRGVAAIKVLSGTIYGGAARLGREGALLERLAGAAAPRLIAVAAHEQPPWLAMELIEGRPLSARLGAVCAPRSVIALGRSLCAALAEVHALGVVHRDLKPSNVIELTTSRIKLLDFGAAAGLGGAADLGPLPLGTPAYTAPEQPDGAIDPRADLYSIGVLLFELACGRRPFSGDPVELLRAHATAPPPRPRTLVPSLPPLLEELILRALSKRPTDRFGDARCMEAALAAVEER